MGGSLGLNLGGRCVRLDTHVLVLHVVGAWVRSDNPAAPEVFPASPTAIRRRSPHAERRIARPAGPDRGGVKDDARRRPGARDACRAVGEACDGLGQRGGDLVGTLGHGIHPGEAGGHGLAPADERLTGDGDGRHADARGRLGDADDDLAAQRLPVEAALARDDEVGGGHEVGEPDGVEHRLDPGHAARTEQVQGVAEPAGCSGAGFALGLEQGAGEQVPGRRPDPGHDAREVAQRVLEPLGVLLGRALLGAEDRARALEAEQRRVDVAGDDEVDAPQPVARGVQAGDVVGRRGGERQPAARRAGRRARRRGRRAGRPPRRWCPNRRAR